MKKKDSFRLKATWPNPLSLKLHQKENITSIEYENLVYEECSFEYKKKGTKSCTRQARNVNPIRTKTIKRLLVSGCKRTNIEKNAIH